MPIIAKPIPTDNPSGALIGFKNLLTSATNSNAEKALIPNTFERFVPVSGPLSIKYSLATNAEIDFIALAAHNVSGETFFIKTGLDAEPLETIEFLAPKDNSPIMLIFDSKTVSDVWITSSSVSNFELGVIYAGKFLQMPTNIYGGHSPITLSQQTEYQSIQSESGQFLNRNIIRKGLETSFDWQFLDPDFYRDEFQLFVESARTTPFFLKWRPDFYSYEVAFGWTTADIKPVNSGGGIRLMSVSMTMKAHADL